MEKQPAAYIMASKRNGTLYTGVTSNTAKRVWEHKNNVIPGFTKRYKVDSLVWFEFHSTMESAITMEKRIKEWKRCWKIELIEKTNGHVFRIPRLFNSLNYVKKIRYFLQITRYLIKKSTFFYISGGIHAVYA